MLASLLMYRCCPDKAIDHEGVQERQHGKTVSHRQWVVSLTHRLPQDTCHSPTAWRFPMPTPSDAQGRIQGQALVKAPDAKLEKQALNPSWIWGEESRACPTPMQQHHHLDHGHSNGQGQPQYSVFNLENYKGGGPSLHHAAECLSGDYNCFSCKLILTESFWGIRFKGLEIWLFNLEN